MIPFLNKVTRQHKPRFWDAAASVAGSVVGGVLASKEGQRARNWNERMAGRAHQLEVADLKAAGLNPILSAGTTGARFPTSPMSNIPGGMEAGKASAIAAKRLAKELDNLTADTFNKNTSAENNIQSAKTGRSVELRNFAENVLLNQQANNAKAVFQGITIDNATKAANLASARAEETIFKNALPYIEKTFQSLDKLVETKPAELLRDFIFKGFKE